MILYKYLKPELVSVLENRLIRFSQPEAFNDPFEFRLTIEEIASASEVEAYVDSQFHSLVEKQLATLSPQSAAMARAVLVGKKGELKALALSLLKNNTPSIAAVLSTKFDEILGARVGLLCLSELRDSILMWGHYADCHRGFVVGFDSEHPFFSTRRGASDEFGFLRKVVYCDERPLLSVARAESAGIDLFQTKARYWEYEREWRILRVLENVTKTIPGTPPICLFEFPADAVREIVVGMRADAIVPEIKRLAPSFPRASFLAATADPTRYALRIIPLMFPK